MNDAEAFELIDAHLDCQPLTEEQSDALTAWIKGDPRKADEAFSRIFLHSYLRMRLQAGLLSDGAELALLSDSASAVLPDFAGRRLVAAPAPERRRMVRTKILLLVAGCILASGISYSILHRFNVMPVLKPPVDKLFAYEGFDYPATMLPADFSNDDRWPTSGGLQNLAGGIGWSDPWQETDSKVAIIMDYSQKGLHWESNDMRKFGPLGYSDSRGNVLLFSGNQMRTATSPRSVSARKFRIEDFPESMRDGAELGADGSVVWFSFLAQSSVSSAEHNRYSYLMIGSKEVSGFRIGKLGAVPLGNWAAVGLLTGAEVNLRSSMYPSGEMVFLVTRIVFRPGPEHATVWINPRLNLEPAEEDASMRLQVPDFRFSGLAIRANHSADFDEIRFGSTFRSVTPVHQR